MLSAIRVASSRAGLALAGESHPTSPPSRGPDQKRTLSADTNVWAGNRADTQGPGAPAVALSLAFCPLNLPHARERQGARKPSCCAPRLCHGSARRARQVESQRDPDPERNTLKDPEKGRQRKRQRSWEGRREMKGEKDHGGQRGRHTSGLQGPQDVYQ